MFGKATPFVAGIAYLLLLAFGRLGPVKRAINKAIDIVGELIGRFARGARNWLGEMMDGAWSRLRRNTSTPPTPRHSSLNDGVEFLDDGLLDHGSPSHWQRNNVEIVDHTGTPLGELDGVRFDTLIEDKSAQNISFMPPGWTTPLQTPAEWAEKQIYGKTRARIRNLERAAASRPTPPGTGDVPTIDVLRSIRRLEFHVDADTPALRAAVEDQLQRLRVDFPGWTFSARYGIRR